jgi:hypothetical protein
LIQQLLQGFHGFSQSLYTNTMLVSWNVMQHILPNSSFTIIHTVYKRDAGNKALVNKPVTYNSTYCGIFAQSKNCEVSSDNRYWVTASLFTQQQLDTTIMASGIFYMVCAEVLWAGQWVELSEVKSSWLVSEWVSKLEDCCGSVIVSIAVRSW